jgi:hypothetical protein
MWLETETKEKMRVGKNKNEGERGKQRAGRGEANERAKKIRRK